MECKIIKDSNGRDVAMVCLEGRLDALQSDKIEDDLLNLVEDGKTQLIINMRKVNYLGSSGIRILLALNNKLNKMEGCLKIVGMPDTGLKILKTMEIIDRFQLYDDEEKVINDL